MPAQTTPITDRQRELITRAYHEEGGLIEPLLDLKGGAKLKMIASLAQRGLIEQQGDQWRLTSAAIAIIKGEAQPEDVLPPTVATSVATPPLADDPELEAAVAAAESSWRIDHLDPYDRAVMVVKKHQIERRKAEQEVTNTHRRPNSKQATVLEMLRRPCGATVGDIQAVTGWQAHTVRGIFANVYKKRMGLTIVSDKPQGGERVYRIAD